VRSGVEKILANSGRKGKLSRAEVPTPALVVELDAFEWNVELFSAPG